MNRYNIKMLKLCRNSYSRILNYATGITESSCTRIDFMKEDILFVAQLVRAVQFKEIQFSVNEFNLYE